MRSQEPQKCAKKYPGDRKTRDIGGKTQDIGTMEGFFKNKSHFFGQRCFFLWGVGSLQKIEFIEVSGFPEQFNTDSVFLGNFFKVGS